MRRLDDDGDGDGKRRKRQIGNFYNSRNKCKQSTKATTTEKQNTNFKCKLDVFFFVALLCLANKYLSTNNSLLLFVLSSPFGLHDLASNKQNTFFDENCKQNCI